MTTHQFKCPQCGGSDHEVLADKIVCRTVIHRPLYQQTKLSCNWSGPASACVLEREVKESSESESLAKQFHETYERLAPSKCSRKYGTASWCCECGLSRNRKPTNPTHRERAKGVSQ